MNGGLRSWIRLVELARFELLAAGVSSVWLMTFLAHAADDPGPVRRLGLATALLLVTVIAIGLIGSGMAFNDVLDARHDRAFAPSRPIPAGRVRVRGVMIAAVITLLCAAAAATALGTTSTLLTLLTAAGILFYNVTGRFVPAVGVVSLGLIVAMLMLIPDPKPAVAWPILLNMTHIMACATLRHWLAGKRPRLRESDGLGILAGWSFWTMVIVILMLIPDASRLSGGGAWRWMWVGPLIAVWVFIYVCWHLLHGALSPGRARRRAAGRFAALAVCWLGVYDACWLASAGLVWQALAVAGLLGVSAAAIVVMRLGLRRRADTGFTLTATPPPAEQSEPPL